MKKGRIILVEALVLIALILVACVICKKMVKAPDDAQPAAATEPTATEPTETEPAPTEPPEPIVPTWLVMDEGYTLSCREYFVYDVAAGVFADSSGVPADTKIYPASITKLFTTYVALQYLSVDKVITAGDVLNLVAAGSSVAEISIMIVMTRAVISATITKKGQKIKERMDVSNSSGLRSFLWMGLAVSFSGRWGNWMGVPGFTGCLAISSRQGSQKTWPDVMVVPHFMHFINSAS